jgi:hypothetical protein
MLLEVFRPDDPVLKVALPPETRQKLEEKLEALPTEVFRADDSLGWVYQFWQRDEKDRVNKSEIEIGADELAAVTQIFTEDYIVLFLLENTLGAWWTAKRRAEGKEPALPGYQWKYLRLNDDGSPAAGAFDGWPRVARDLHVLDPCMGSGHFLTFALPILARMRMEEEGLALQDALATVLRDNLLGLELDVRCSHIAAFNLALTAWRLAGEHFPLSAINLGCSGLGINAKEEDWVRLAGKDDRVRETMRRLYHLFQQAPVLGSLLDPKRVGGTLFVAEFEKVQFLLDEALAQTDEDPSELAVTAQGLVHAARILADNFTLVATNVPYLGRVKQTGALKVYLDRAHPDSKWDLATAFVERCQSFCSPSGTFALVTPQQWCFGDKYTSFRKKQIRQTSWRLLARLGTNAFSAVSGEVVNVILVIGDCMQPIIGHPCSALDVTDYPSPETKINALRSLRVGNFEQHAQLRNPDSRITLQDATRERPLSALAKSTEGLSAGDGERFIMMFWEKPSIDPKWAFLQSAPPKTEFYSGLSEIVLWEDGRGEMARSAAARIRGHSAWGKAGVVVSKMNSVRASVYMGGLFSKNCVVLSASEPKICPALFELVSAPRFEAAVLALDANLNTATSVFEKVPFDLGQWQQIAMQKHPTGLPKPHSADSTQSIFAGHPKGSEQPLQAAVARLLGYRWPRQTGSSFPDCPALSPDGLEMHASAEGIVCLTPLAGEESAADRLRALLTGAYGEEWSATKLTELLGDWESLEVWLRNRFFEEHCEVFHNRPFIWHVWDGRKDGFHALVNYHKLTGPNGAGRKSLERLIYTLLGDWITRQKSEVAAGTEGADARFAAAQHLKAELQKILKGEKPYDIFIRWKPLREQPIGWEPDINDGVRLNIRPWLTTKPYKPSRKDACILRVTPRIPYGKDRGKEPDRPKEEYPWFWTWDGQTDDFTGGLEFDGARWNDLHYSLAFKQRARKCKAGA